jgi:Zn-finger nucleic acid-binding protein
LFYIFLLLIQAGPAGWISMGIIAVIAYIAWRASQKNKSSINRIQGPSSAKPFAEVSGASDFLSANAGFDEAAFLGKVQKAFLEVQEAWASGNVSAVRRFMTAGVYRRFTTQLALMAELGQHDEISGTEIQQLWIDRVENDGSYDILHVAVRAGMSDRFVCEKMPELNSPGGFEVFTEYWSFLRKRNAKASDVFSNSLCPNCGAALPRDLGDAGQCPSCKAYVDSGEFDWVLSEITQSDDYHADRYRAFRVSGLADRLKDLVGANADFCVQLLEDKASDAYLQLMRAVSERDPARMRRFTSDAAFGKLSNSMPEVPFFYNRLWLNAVNLVAAKTDEAINRLYFAVRRSSQRVRTQGQSRPILLDSAITADEDVIVLSRSADAGRNQGSLYSHRCPSCGAPVSDSLELKCPYCGSVYNNVKNEWIVDDLMSMSEFRELLRKNRDDFDYALQKNLMELYQVRDYAWNNALLIMAADGVFQDEERDLALELAKRWSIDTSGGKLDHWFDLAKTGQLVLRMPDDPGKRRQVYKLMQRSAQSAGSISPEAQRILDTVREKYL